MGDGVAVSERVVHMVGNAHIDPVWLWQWPEGYQEVRATFQSAIDRMEEYPDFVFTSDSVLFFAWIEEHDPRLFGRIQERVAEGRWQVIGGWWIEPDCNIPAGESYARQALYGQRYLREKFGVTATVGANIDSFGHNATLPQLLAKSGLDAYVFLRPQAHELELPAHAFRWETADGSSVAAYRIPHEYCSPRGDLDEHVEKALAQLPPEPRGLMVFYGVGNHGGGPTKANLDSITRLNEDGTAGRLALSGPRAFFDSLGDGELPVHRGELQHHGPGCYTSHSGVKRWNRRTENLLLRAEKWCAIADVVAGTAYPREQLPEAWKLLLFNQFHDTLAGTSIAPAYEDARDQLGHAASLAASAFNRAAQSVARAIDIQAEEDMTPVVVFNAHPWPVRTDVELEFGGFRESAPRLVDEAGAPVPIQRTRGYSTLSSPRGRFVFPADLPPLGYRVYRLYPGGGEGGGVEATETTLENGRLLLELDPATGGIARLVLKATGGDLAGAGPHAVVIDDRSDTWGHGVRAYDDVVGEFACRSLRLVENGPVRAILRVESVYESSTLVEEYVLGADSAYVDVRVALDWREPLRMLKLRYPTSVDAEAATFEIPYGSIERRAGGDEEPGQAWVDVSGDGAGLSVLNDAKYGYDVRRGDIGISAVRSPVWAWHAPRELDADGIYEYMDLGRQDFAIRLVPHEGDWRHADVVRLAAQLNQPPFALLESYHSGELPPRMSFVSVASESVVATVLKAAEDGEGFVIRAYETAGRSAKARIDVELLDRSFDATFGPCEIKTFRVPRDPAEPIAETDLLEGLTPVSDTVR